MSDEEDNSIGTVGTGGGTSRSYCSISEVMKLISAPFAGDKSKLREFLDNVDTAFELVDPANHVLLLKFVKTKITGEARSKLLVRDLTVTWEQVKSILEENYATRRTIDYYACRMFSSRQERSERISSWGSRVDQMQSELRLATSKVCSDKELEGAISLINYLARACFIQGLANERIQTIVRSRGERLLLSTAVEIALEEESALLSAKDRGLIAHRSEGESRASYSPDSGYRRPRYRANVIAEQDSRRMIKCYACGSMGHYARDCRKSNNAWSQKQGGTRQAQGNGPRGQVSSQPGSRRM